MNVILIVATIIYIDTQCNWYEKYVETCCISNDSIGTFFPVPPSFPTTMLFYILFFLHVVTLELN